MKRLRSYRDVIRCWPTFRAMAVDLAAQDLGELKPPNRDAINMWRVRDRIPVAYFPAVVSAAHARGYPEVTMRLLDELTEKPKIEEKPDGRTS